MWWGSRAADCIFTAHSRTAELLPMNQVPALKTKSNVELLSASFVRELLAWICCQSLQSLIAASVSSDFSREPGFKYILLPAALLSEALLWLEKILFEFLLPVICGIVKGSSRPSSNEPQNLSGWEVKKTCFDCSWKAFLATVGYGVSFLAASPAQHGISEGSQMPSAFDLLLPNPEETNLPFLLTEVLFRTRNCLYDTKIR